MKYSSISFLILSVCILSACGGGSSSGSGVSSAPQSSSSSIVQSSSSSSSTVESSSSSTAIFITPPEIFRMIATSSQVLLRWSAVSRASSYNIYYATESFSSIQSVANYAALSGGTMKRQSSLDVTGRVVTDLINDTTYYFVVTAVVDGVETAKSIEWSATPMAVVGDLEINTYINIEFSLNAGDMNYGRFFSITTGEIYKDSEINETTGPLINIAFGSLGQSLHYFESPTVEKYNVPNAMLTQFINYEATPTISIEAFDSMTDASGLMNLTIEETGDGFSTNAIPNTILFQAASGQKGVIRTKAINSNRILVDIKVQK